MSMVNVQQRYQKERSLKRHMFNKFTAVHALSLVEANYSPEAKHSFGGGDRGNTIRGKKSVVHAFGYNSAESEPIWMKSGAL